MRVLIVHDREEARKEIEEIVGAECNESQVETESTYNGARDAMNSKQGRYYDVLILDLTLPINALDSRPPTVENAQALLKELFDGNELKTPGDVIGVSYDIPAVESTNAQFADQVITLLEESKDSNWQSQLAAKLRYIRRANKARLGAEITEYGKDVLIVTALDKEAAPYEDLFELSELDPEFNIKEFAFTDKDGTLRSGVLHSVGQAGQAPTASATQTLLTRYRPRVSIMSGFCGGIREKVELMDVVAFNSSYAWDNGKWVHDKSTEKPVFRPRPNPIDQSGDSLSSAVRELLKDSFLAEPVVVKRVKELCSGTDHTDVKFYRQPAGSGSAVVSEGFIAESIRNLNDDIWVVDMESYGFYYACRNTRSAKPAFLCVKSVSDFCDPEKDDKVQNACSFLSAHTVKTILTSFLGF
ncbi:S-adenosylhomocysteine nucleosidase [Roseovarius sp. A-2]|uniref:phosphorylase family protein n=1 Tax=Roseovarius sp. A-2 TaxID=1570360 RepID=UPI0009B5981C|nr:hypothetical protein [Roseovarius sp. A-2]GAW37327.1 S-adenosylhomocysteine nucleosidase [Roseovarius sp. A-2]